MPYWSVPRMWPDSLVILLGGGPSLTQTNWDLLKGHKVIAINESFRLYPAAEILYFCDAQFHRWRKNDPEFRKFRGIKVSIAQQLANDPDVQVLKIGGERGFPAHPDTLTTGSNSGHQAIVLAALLGAKTIVLLGFDMKVGAKGQKHWHQNYPSESTADIYETKFLPAFPFLVKPLAEQGVTVVNCTPGSALKIFPMMSLDEVLTAEQQRSAA